jgi:hypothetical protein
MRAGLAALLALAALPAAASTFLHMSRAELVAAADAVVVGRVASVESFWTDSGRLIVTEATVTVERTVVGQAPAQLVIRTAGGTVDKYSVEAHGFPEFVAGQRLLVFLRAAASGEARWEVVGYRQGQYRILRDAAGRDLAVPAVEEGARYLRADGSAPAAPAPVELVRLTNDLRQTGRRLGKPVE